jgi:hypothetical protein
MNEKMKWMKNWGFDSRQHKFSFEGLIMLDLWLWKLMLKEMERIYWYGVPIKLWLGLINDIGNLIEEWISLRI